MARTNSYRTFVTEFPNIFLATTYALNKSNSKRVCIGLEHYNGYFHEVVKLINTDKYNTTVTLDHHDWNCFRDQFEPINSYFNDSYAFYREHGKPNKIFLSHHDLAFTTSYGTKSILLEERPQSKEEKTANNDNNQSMDTDEPHCKKMKLAKAPPSIVMQYPTFEGLRKQAVLIDLALDELKGCVGKVNRTLDLINEYLQDKMQKEGEEQNNRIILSDLKGFQGFYGVLNADIEGYVTEKLPSDDDYFINDKLKFILAEILAYGLPIIMNDLRNSFNIVS